LLRPKGLGIIGVRELFDSNHRCLLSSANDGKGRCVLYG
jgi:hypothetical protein